MGDFLPLSIRVYLRKSAIPNHKYIVYQAVKSWSAKKRAAEGKEFLPPPIA